MEGVTRDIFHRVKKVPDLQSRSTVLSGRILLPHYQTLACLANVRGRFATNPIYPMQTSTRNFTGWPPGHAAGTGWQSACCNPAAIYFFARFACKGKNWGIQSK